VDRSGDERPAPDVFQLYVGGISREVRQADLDDLFAKFNPILAETQMKGKYAFVAFTNQKDADDAVADINGTTFKGTQLTVEFASKSSPIS
jgi:RNA recognition motif-containing protein